MSQDSLLKAVRLGRKQLLDTKCWVDPLAKGLIDIEISHTVEISAHDKSKGSSYDLHVLTKTELVGRAEDKSEAVRVSFSFPLDDLYPGFCDTGPCCLSNVDAHRVSVGRRPQSFEVL